MSWWPFSSAGGNAQTQSQAPAPAPHMSTSIPVQQSSQQPRSDALTPTSTPPPSSISDLPPASIPDPQRPPPTTQDADFYAVYPHLAPALSSTPQEAPSQATPSSPTAPSATPNDDLDPYLPRTMSCRAAFDSAFYCSSLGGHFNDIYRYGQLRSCTEHWNDFWFCMRTKNSYNPQETKERMIQDRYREKEDKVRKGPSSEDVWRLRGEEERVVGAFRGAAAIGKSK